MKKLTAMLLTAICAANVSVAQETVTGVVVDKKGNPLPGVRIEVPGTPDQAISDLDGSFTLYRSDQSKKKLYATYAGMNSKKVKIKDGMRIKMSEYNWWTQQPDKWDWLIQQMVVFPQYKLGKDRVFDPAFGLMVGYVKKFGFYAKGVTNTFGWDAQSWSETDKLFVKKQKSIYWNATGGVIVRLGCPIHLYVGAGYAYYGHFLISNSDNWYTYDEVQGVAVEAGVMLRIKKFTLSLGTCHGNVVDDFYYKNSFAGNFGIGYTF